MRRSGMKLVLILLTCICALMSILILSYQSVQAQGAFTLLNLPMLENIDVFLKKDVIEIKMEFSQKIDYKDFTLKNPARFVIDVEGGWYLKDFSKLNFTDPLLKEVRFFRYGNDLRIVAELKYEGPGYELIWNSTLKILTMTIKRSFTHHQVTSLANGVKYHYIKKGLNAGPVIIHGLEVQINPYVEGKKILEEIGSPYPTPEVSLRVSYHKGSLRGFSKISKLVQEEGGFAGINGGYFGPDGMPLGLLIRDGELVSGPIYDRTAWGIDQGGNMRIERVSLQGEVVINYFNRYTLSGINRPRYSDELIIYTPPFGLSTNTNQWGKEIIVKNNRVVEISMGNSVIPTDGFVISAHGKAREFLKNVKKGDLIQIFFDMNPDWLSQGIVQAIGGGPQLLSNGFIKITGKEEKFLPDILIGRAPRSALGITPDNRLLMVSVAGRSRYSIGMTLQELAELMLALGAWDAMNLDGGSSSTLIIRDKVLNSAITGEVSVHNGLILKIE